MTPSEPQVGTNTETNRTCLTQGQLLTLAAVAALIGAGLALLINNIIKAPDSDPDRPPIIVRDGSVLIEVDANANQGKFEKEPGKRIWYHDHTYTGPKTLNAFVAGVANSSCGSAGAYFRPNVNKLTVTYEVESATKDIDIKLGTKRIDVDIDNYAGTPDPDTTVNTWTLKFDRPPAVMTQVVLNGPGGPPVTCRLNIGARITITQHH